MAGTSDEEMESLLSTFDQIYEDFKGGITEINSLKSSYNTEINRRESLQITCNSLKQDNERLMKLYGESLNKLAYQMERRTKCESLKEELKKVTEDHLSKEEEYKKAVELLKQEHRAEVGDLETQVRCSLLQQSEKEETINQLRADLATQKTRIEALSGSLERLHADVESKYYQEIQELKDWLLVEQEEQRMLNKKLQFVEKELEDNRKKLQEQQRDSTSNRHVETLKQKIMKLRKENELLKRQMNNMKDRAEEGIT